MKDQEYISPDELFRNNLRDAEADFEPAAWDHMQKLLDGEDAVRPVGFLFGFNLKNNKHKLFIIMSSILILSGIAGLVHFMTGDGANLESKQTNNPEKTLVRKTSEGLIGANSSAKSAKISLNSSAQKENAEDGTVRINAKSAVAAYSRPEKAGRKAAIANGTKLSGIGAEKQLAEGGSNTFWSNIPVAGHQVAAANNDGFVPGFKTPVRFKTLQPEVKDLSQTRLLFSADSVRKRLARNDYTFRDGFIGMHFTWQNPLAEELIDSTRQNAGFNIQFMSRNLMSQSPWGGYLGFDFGMQFYGRGKRTNVALNTVSGDSGWTRLSTISFDFFARGHLEFAAGKIVPYINGFAGPRLYSTNQRVESFLPLKETESGSTSNASVSMSMMYGLGAGLRFRLSDVVSLDFRGEYMAGTPVKMVDLDNSSFNGLTYNLKKFTANPEYYQLKFGVLFNIGDDETYQQTTNNQQQTQYIYRNVESPAQYEYYDSSSGKWMSIPMCPCNCDSTGKSIDPKLIRKKRSSQSINFDSNDSDSDLDISIPGRRRNRERGGSSWPSVPSGSGKGSFPGISPGGGIKIKS